jgi:methyl-accepting chemotaxis protein
MTSKVDQISQVVQTNSATAEELAASTEELASQSQIIKTEISKYTLKSK